MSVRKRTWFTQAQRKQIDPEAQRLAKAANDSNDWRKFKYLECAGLALGIEPQTAWIVDYADQDGDRHIETFPKKDQAMKRHAEVTVAVGKGMHTAPSKSITVAEAAERWIDQVKANGMKGDGPAERSTLRQYRQHIDLHIVPRLGKTKLSQLNKPAAEKFQKDLIEKLSRPLAKKVFTSFKSLLKVSGYSQVAESLVIGADKRRRELEAGLDYPTLAEVKRLIEAAEARTVVCGDQGDKGRVHALLMTVAMTGLRASELRGLRWSDVDLKAEELHVRQRADRYSEIGPPKSKSGTRSVPLPPELLSALKVWKLACPKGEDDLVFPSSTGRIEHHSNMLRSLAPVMKAAGVMAPERDEHGTLVRDNKGKQVMGPKYALHAFRHFFASWCINTEGNGGRELPVKEVQQLLGHGSVVMTLDVYGHLFPKGNDKAELAKASARLLA